MNGGTPYEKDVAVEASVTRGCKKTEQMSERGVTLKNNVGGGGQETLEL